MPQTRQLKQQKPLSDSSGELDQGVGRVGFFCGLFPWFADSCLLPVSLHSPPSVPLGSLLSSPCKDTSHTAFSSVQSLFTTPWTAARQASLLPCPSSTPRACSNPCPLSQWCHPTISSSVVPFSSCPQSFPASESFSMSQLFASGAQVLELQLQHQSFQWIFRTDFL